MLQSQRDTTRLSQKFTEPRRARPFDSYSQDELRFRMMELDGCNRSMPPEAYPLAGKAARASSEVKRRRMAIADAIRKAGVMTLPEVREAFPHTGPELIKSDLRRLKAEGVLSNRPIRGNVWEWRAV